MNVDCPLCETMIKIEKTFEEVEAQRELLP